MAISSSTLFPLVLSLFLLMMVANKVQSQVPDTTSFTYNSFSPTSEGLTYQGDAFVPSGSSALSLTKTDASGNPTKYSVGRVVYTPPVQFWKQGLQATFETSLSFVIKSVDSDPADGITFFIIPAGSPIPPGSTGGNFGIFDSDTGTAPSVFAVEFDIYVNKDKGDPDYRHIGIDINSRVSRNVSKLENVLGQVVNARINYVSSTRTITVLATYGSQNASVSYVFDLKTILPQQVQVGLSAGTGGQVALHNIYSWYFTSTLVWDGNNAYIRQYA